MSEKELMKVVGFYEGLPIDDPKSFIDEKEQIPVPSSRDLLVKVNAVSVNPVDNNDFLLEHRELEVVKKLSCIK